MYKILVLSDLKNNTDTTLKNSVSLAKMIKGEIALFHVKKHIDIVEGDNQLSAIRTLNQEHNNTKNNIGTLVKSISKNYDVPVTGSYAFGKIKEEITNKITLYKPDIVVLGQRDSKPLKLIGDSITRFVLKEFKGIVMISGNKNTLIPNEKMTLGVLNNSSKILDSKISKDLKTHIKSPLKSFKIVNSNNQTDNTVNANQNKSVEYVFEQNSNTMTTLSSYLIKNSINLLCVDRTFNKTGNISNTPLKSVLNNLNVSLLVSEA